MKILQLAKIKTATGRFVFGASNVNNSIVDFSRLPSKYPQLTGKVENLHLLMASGPNTIRELKELFFNETFDDITINEPYSYESPVDPVRNIMCIGKNYLDHILEVSKHLGNKPEYPVLFTKATTAVVGHKTILEHHSKLTKYLDYEAELAVIIGKGGKNISSQDAWNHVFGYTVANDITARDLQKQHNQFFKGKSLDTTCPLGPYIVPASDVNPSDLGIKLWLNSELKQNSRTSNMIFDIPAIISTLSQGMTLLPGDVILTGTPDGVGYAKTPPRTLLPGDHVKIEIEGVGILENTVSTT